MIDEPEEHQKIDWRDLYCLVTGIDLRVSKSAVQNRTYDGSRLDDFRCSCASADELKSRLTQF